MVFKQKSFLPWSKPLISILESSRDDRIKTQFTSVKQMLCSTNLDISKLHRVFAGPFFKPEYKLSLVPFFAPPFQINYSSTRGRGRGIYHNAEEKGRSRIHILHSLVPTLVSGASFPPIILVCVRQLAGSISRCSSGWKELPISILCWIS